MSQFKYTDSERSISFARIRIQLCIWYGNPCVGLYSIEPLNIQFNKIIYFVFVSITTDRGKSPFSHSTETDFLKYAASCVFMFSFICVRDEIQRYKNKIYSLLSFCVDCGIVLLGRLLNPVSILSVTNVNPCVINTNL